MPGIFASDFKIARYSGGSSKSLSLSSAYCFFSITLYDGPGYFYCETELWVVKAV